MMCIANNYNVIPLYILIRIENHLVDIIILLRFGKQLLVPILMISSTITYTCNKSPCQSSLVQTLGEGK